MFSQLRSQRVANVGRRTVYRVRPTRTGSTLVGRTRINGLMRNVRHDPSTDQWAIIGPPVRRCR